jgi:hypothetical protein
MHVFSMELDNKLSRVLSRPLPGEYPCDVQLCKYPYARYHRLMILNAISIGIHLISANLSPEINNMCLGILNAESLFSIGYAVPGIYSD